MVGSALPWSEKRFAVLARRQCLRRRCNRRAHRVPRILPPNPETTRISGNAVARVVEALASATLLPVRYGDGAPHLSRSESSIDSGFGVGSEATSRTLWPQ